MAAMVTLQGGGFVSIFFGFFSFASEDGVVQK